MKAKKMLKISALSILGVISILFVILVYHIVHVQPIENPNIQISRIDFDVPFDSASTIEIKEKLHAIEGVKKDIIVKNNVVVYYHDNNIADSKKVYSELIASSDYKAKPFVLPASMANKQVCPVIKKDSFKYKFAQIVRKVFS